MRKNRGKWRSVIIGLAVAVMLTGCGASASEKADYAYATESYDNSSYATDDVYMMNMSEAPMEEAMTEEAVEEADVQETGAQQAEMQQSNRKLIKNVNLEVETENFDELYAKVNEKTEALGGYVENSYIYNGSSYYSNDTRDANLTIRIPAENLNVFLSEVSEASNVISRNDSVTDVTLQYVDLESKKEALIIEQDRLLELLEEAETIEDIIALEGRLSEVRYELESMESQLRTLDNQVSYSTVYLYIQEVAKLTPVKEQSLGEKIVTGFTESLYGVGKGLLDFAVGFIIKLPYIVVWAVVIVACVFIVKGICKVHKKRKAKKQMAKAEKVKTETEAK
ncbi:MAG: DUF4349 domain-containing protein [Lachnospiraceae bacterium]|nr:DUF4349 domain-containing protein [Lachnospiraceae bacterium]